MPLLAPLGRGESDMPPQPVLKMTQLACVAGIGASYTSRGCIATVLPFWLTPHVRVVALRRMCYIAAVTSAYRRRLAPWLVSDSPVIHEGSTHLSSMLLLSPYSTAGRCGGSWDHNRVCSSISHSWSLAFRWPAAQRLLHCSSPPRRAHRARAARVARGRARAGRARARARRARPRFAHGRARRRVACSRAAR